MDSIPETSRTTKDFVHAAFPIGLNLRPASNELVLNARKAIRQEYHDSIKWKRMYCSSATRVSGSEEGVIYRLEIDHAIEFDWTWEGAIAFRPLRLAESVDSTNPTDEPDDIFSPIVDDSILWSGELLEVDEASCSLFILVGDPRFPPSRGSFYVRPFEFLAFLNAVYSRPDCGPIQQRLPERLRATRGNVHPDIAGGVTKGLEHLQSWWRKSWSILWGPPGTGKTYTIGQQIAQVLANQPSNGPTERMLVVSTTNRATDAIAISIGQAFRSRTKQLGEGRIMRLGKGASFKRFEEADLLELLKGTDIDYLARIEALAKRAEMETDPEKRAVINHEIKILREEMRDASFRAFFNADTEIVISTAFKATMNLDHEDLRNSIRKGLAPFTTLIVDEAGLMSRAAIAALSLLASRRVVLVGDPKQLSPISRICRSLTPEQGDWLAHSGLNHLVQFDETQPGVHVLTQQRRMHPDICDAVSQYQYDGKLETHSDVLARSGTLPKLFTDHPRAIWLVLDHETTNLAQIRPSRGPGNRSWIRKVTKPLLEKLFEDPDFRSIDGLFISPYKAQAKSIQSFFAKEKARSWSASTVHSQQGAEADLVVFDTVNAGSTAWSNDEWQRLINVAISRAKQAVLVLASRAEMDQPYLSPLKSLLAPRKLVQRNHQLRLKKVAREASYQPPATAERKLVYDSARIGDQLKDRQSQRPILSHEQQRLCQLTLDGKPRLVRGVAGSGKTVVLAHWIVQTVQASINQSDYRIWVVFANQALKGLIEQTINLAWQKATGKPSFPWACVDCYHVRDVLKPLLRSVGLSMYEYKFKFNKAAQDFLARRPADQIEYRCDHLFVDEAQDMGPDLLKLLSRLARQTDPADANSRSVNIFYDNAQNVYGCGTPRWSELGLDMRGRSTVMRESFRSTRPITEFALNLLYRLKPLTESPDHRELVQRGLIEATERNRREWWKVRFNQVDGPTPELKLVDNPDQEIDQIADYLRYLIVEQQVQPRDICLIYNGKKIKQRIGTLLAPAMQKWNIEVSIQTSKTFERRANLLLATTPHSFKGYDAEIVIVAGADRFILANGEILGPALYVAMTRARSMLVLFGLRCPRAEPVKRLNRHLQDCLSDLQAVPKFETIPGWYDIRESLLAQIGRTQNSWLDELWNRFGTTFSIEPILSAEGDVMAAPDFWFVGYSTTYACYGEPPDNETKQMLKQNDIRLLQPGEPVEPPAEPTLFD